MRPNNMNPQTTTPQNDPKRILIIDDDEVILAALSMKISSVGYSVLAAKDGSEAISAIKKFNPQLIILDINFPPDIPHGGCPAWDGFSIMYWLRRQEAFNGAPFIVMSIDNSDVISQRCIQAGALAFLPKPISHADLLALIQNHLGQ